MTQRLLAFGAVAVVAAVLAWLLFVEIPRRYGPSITPEAAVPVEPAPAGKKIKARLFYVSENGLQLTQVEHDIVFAESPVDQAREIIFAQLAPVAAPLVSAMPPGTTLRSVFLTQNGQAYVDLSREVALAHTGGTLAELLTVYTIVDALTVNLPAITSVQILIDGKEAATLAGHVDLRQPLAGNLAWVQ